MDRAALEREIALLLYREAELLDGGRFEEWLQLLDEELRYVAPVRLTRERGELNELTEEMVHFHDDRETLTMRVRRLYTDFAWAEDPPSRTRRFISNIRVDWERSDGERLYVKSYFLLYRTRGADPAAELIAGERQDVWRRVDGGFRLRERKVIFDQAALNVRGISVFL